MAFLPPKDPMLFRTAAAAALRCPMPTSATRMELSHHEAFDPDEPPSAMIFRSGQSADILGFDQIYNIGDIKTAKEKSHFVFVPATLVENHADGPRSSAPTEVFLLVTKSKDTAVNSKSPILPEAPSAQYPGVMMEKLEKVLQKQSSEPPSKKQRLSREFTATNSPMQTSELHHLQAPPQKPVNDFHVTKERQLQQIHQQHNAIFQQPHAFAPVDHAAQTFTSPTPPALFDMYGAAPSQGPPQQAALSVRQPIGPTANDHHQIGKRVHVAPIATPEQQSLRNAAAASYSEFQVDGYKSLSTHVDKQDAGEKALDGGEAQATPDWAFIGNASRTVPVNHTRNDLFRTHLPTASAQVQASPPPLYPMAVQASLRVNAPTSIAQVQASSTPMYPMAVQPGFSALPAGSLAAKAYGQNAPKKKKKSTSTRKPSPNPFDSYRRGQGYGAGAA